MGQETIVSIPSIIGYKFLPTFTKASEYFSVLVTVRRTLRAIWFNWNNRWLSMTGLCQSDKLRILSGRTGCNPRIKPRVGETNSTSLRSMSPSRMYFRICLAKTPSNSSSAGRLSTVVAFVRTEADKITNRRFKDRVQPYYCMGQETILLFELYSQLSQRLPYLVGIIIFRY